MAELIDFLSKQKFIIHIEDHKTITVRWKLKSVVLFQLRCQTAIQKCLIRLFIHPDVKNKTEANSAIGSTGEETFMVLFLMRIFLFSEHVNTTISRI